MRAKRRKIMLNKKMRNKNLFFLIILAVIFCPIFLIQAVKEPTTDKPSQTDWDQYYKQMYLSTSTGMGAFMNWNQMGISFSDYQKKVEELLNTPTGKMTVALDLELTARISACHASSSVLGEEEFNRLKEPYDITAAEYTAYHLKFFEMIANDEESSEQYSLFNKAYEKRVKELKDNGCNFEAVAEALNKDGCYDEDGDNPDRFNITYIYDKKGEGKCHPCKFADECVGNNLKEKICKKDEGKCLYGCWDEVVHKCPFGCFAGRCQTEEESRQQQCDGQCLAECPAGTMDFGQGGCPQAGNNFPAKCCKKVFSTSTTPVGKCEGMCAKSDQCPEGYEKKDETSCAQIETKYKCGPFGLFDCYNYVSPVCCLPKAENPPSPSQCAGECVMGSKCPGRSLNKGVSGCESFQECKPCGFFGLKKCCKYVPTTCCEYPKPVTECSKGMCTYQECPSGMEDVGVADCGTIKECKTCYLVGKCCKKKTARCCMAVNREICASGQCQKSGQCPTGYENIGPADCGSYQKEEDCGFAGWAKCKKPAPMTCCMPKAK